MHAQSILVTPPQETANMLERIVMTATHVPSTLAMTETALTLLSFALTQILAQKTLAILSRDASTLLNTILNLFLAQTNATLTAAIAWTEISLRAQSFVMTITLVLLTLAILQLAVSSLQSTAKELTNVSHLLAIKTLENVSSDQFFVTMETNAQLTPVMHKLENVFTKTLTVMITMLAQLTLAMLQVESAYMFLKSVTIKTFAQPILAILALETVFSLISLLNWLQQNHQINVSIMLVMQLSELPPLLSLALMVQLVPQLIAILQEDVFMTQSLAAILDALIMLATHLLTSARLLFLAAMMVMLVPSIPSIHLPAVNTLLCAFLLICAQSPLALLELATTVLKIAMIATLAQSTLAISALELVSTLQSPALAELETLELAIQVPLNVLSDKLARTTVTVLEMEIQLTLGFVILLLVAISKSTPIINLWYFWN
jgi:hypothetical protein